MSPGDPSRRRADAARNVDLLLAAARELVDTHGSDVALDEVARRAGVGNATLYRHFPTRADLLVAVYADEVEALCQRGASLLAAPSPVDALFAWLDDFVAHVVTKRALALAATEGPVGRRTQLFDEWHGSIHSSAAHLLDRARDTGTIRPDLTVVDLLALASGAALTSTGLPQAQRLLGFLRRGILDAGPPAFPRR
jgi:AcrR family transcriptional regulator